MELFKPEFGLVFWMFLAFACLYFILAKWAWPFIIKSMDERAKLIDEGVAYAQEAKSSATPTLLSPTHASSRPTFCATQPR